MANFKLQMDGLNELRTALQQLPEQLATEAGDIVMKYAEGAKQDIQRGYPQRTGNLRRGVTVQRNRSKVATQAIVRSKAPHANIFERGTTWRHTDRGWNRGAMPQPDESQRFIPKAIRYRRAMVEELIELVRRAGFEVSS